MDYIKGLPLAPHRCRSAPHQLPLATAVCSLEITKEVKIPEVKEIHIKLPTAEPKRTLLPKPEKKEFVF